MNSAHDASSATLRPRALARRIAAAFDRYNAEFRAITRRAPARFERRDWRGSQRDAVERIELYDRCVNGLIAEMLAELGEQARSCELWRCARDEFAGLVRVVPDAEFSKTFFSSVSRRLFGTVGVAPQIEFMATELDALAISPAALDLRTYVNRGSLPLLVEDLLGGLRFGSPWKDLENSIRQVTAEITHHFEPQGAAAVQRIEAIRPVFYQMSRAYVVARVCTAAGLHPLVIALKNTDQGILVDAVMLTESDVSIVFSFARSYFHVDLVHVVAAVGFLRSVLPRKPVSELFTALGRARQGKAERYREVMLQLEASSERFVHAPGERGLVMICFTLASGDVVFKVIRDRFPLQKNVRREEVMAKYELVFKHDRAGRLVDAQEFRRVRLPRERFAPELLAELTAEAAGSVQSDGADLIFSHMYIERRMTPLNVYLRRASAEDAERAAVDYGQCIRDLACSNIFPGDLLLKNFGVTRHGRVIFYDYDELCHVTDCHFRELPRATSLEDELRGEPWFYVGDGDVFPETFIRFLAFSESQRAALLRAHGEILTAAFWASVRERLLAGEPLEVLPYPPHGPERVSGHGSGPP